MGCIGISAREAAFWPAKCSSNGGMLIHRSGATAPEVSQAGAGIRALFRRDHKSIGLQYLWLALLSVFLGTILSLAMRLHAAWPGSAGQLSGPLATLFGGSAESYAALTLLHGSLMVFLVLTAAPQAGFGSYLLPVQVGAQDLAFPVINLVGFWATVASLVGITASFFLPPGSDIELWIASVALFSVAGLLTSLNFSVTVIDLRTKGMTLPRMPVTVWAWFINAILSLLIFSILLAACLCLLADRVFGAHIFAAVGAVAGSLGSAGNYASSPEMSTQWQRLFWFFAQALVYVAMLPCFGLATHLIATFARRPVWAERAVVLAFCAVGVLGFCIWGQHLFMSGLDPFSPLVFSQLAASLGFPAAVLLVSWFATLWNSSSSARIQLTTSMLFALGFVSLFLVGGLSGLILSRHDLAGAAGGGEFIAGHYHLVMGVAATFAMLAALFFWFPKMFGRHLDERLGKIHFWLTFVGVFCLFMPMHWLGLIAHAGIAPQNPQALAAVTSFLQSLVSFATLFTAAAQTFFVANIVRSLRQGAPVAQANAWRATTLEWSLSSPIPEINFAGAPTVYRGAYEFSVTNCAADFVPQHIPPSDLPRSATAEAHGTDARDIDLRGGSMPSSPQPAGAG
jgi:cytochrome c oxidase subunit I